MQVAAPPPGGTGGGDIELAVPRPAAGLQLLGEMSHSGFREPPCLARRADGQMLQLTPLLYTVLAAVDGRRDLGAIATSVGDAIDKDVTAEDIAFLIDQKLRPLGAVCDAEGQEPAVEKANPLLALRFRFVVSRPELTRAVTQPFTWLFRPPVVAVALIAFALAVGWVLLGHGLGGGLRTMLYDPKQLVMVFALAALSAGFHEFGHAAACRYGGATPGAMGAGLYLVWPAFYTDVTDSYRLDRRGRLRTDLGGLYFNCIFTIAMVAVAWATGAESLFVLVPLQLLQMVHQLLPILRLDGYHILADLTGVPDLYARIRPTLRSALPGTAVDERVAALKPGARRTVTAWTLIVVPVLIFSLGSAALAMPRLAATAADSLALHWRVMQAAWAEGQVFSVLAGILSLFAIVLPVAGTILIVQRIGSRIWRYLWNRFETPPARTLLAAIAAILALALATAWWPSRDYRPLGADERLRVQDLPIARAISTRQLTPLVSTGVAEPGDGAVAVRASSAPEARAGSARGAVVEGDDNLALAINTADGASIFRLAFTIRSLAGGTIDQSNMAIALASCDRCSTVALAFQVLLIFGESDTVTPENRAVALNASCTACLTFAAATQIILGFDGPVELTPEGQRRLDELHQSLLALEERAGSLDAETLAAKVAAAKEELAAILSEELVPVEPEAPPEETETPEDEGEQEDQQDEEEEDAGTSTTTSSTSSTSTTSSTTTSTVKTTTTTEP